MRGCRTAFGDLFGDLRADCRPGSLRRCRVLTFCCSTQKLKPPNTQVRDKISYRHWVSDDYVATPSKTGFSKPGPRC